MAKKILVSVAWPYANGYQHLVFLSNENRLFRNFRERAGAAERV